ncbi:SDR family NAD(P)-dependent oxidoreductase [Sphingomonas morindae]|uniref:SDR family NAD(P)-dependent oxidoreductase n=1 Tax=Sphingomonas morindae TaxID=1541170 RepID=A0ABY4XDB0_9SPHN|nr:SDR family NAD(P)-dependent oxidoreductase [Sphingomonas morindae]USI74838.1 SDR family NAD(P)-dependent oxidoreductase [Sphingomonas morindae]
MAEAERRAFALITGGDNGIGLALAREFADHGYDLLIAGETESHVADAAHSLSQNGARIETFAGDLGRADQVDALIETVRRIGRPLDIACVNAGIGLGGAFIDTDLATELQMIDLNVRGAVQLSKALVKDMVARGEGQLLFTSSIAATMPDPFEAVYGATKVFLRWFGEALRNELKDSGVGVTVLMPGVTDTNFFNRADMLDTRAGASESKDDPADVARAAFAALRADKDKVLPKLKNKVMGAIAEALPDPIGAQVHRGMSEPGSAG